jgi:hypothetical protein
LESRIELFILCEYHLRVIPIYLKDDRKAGASEMTLAKSYLMHKNESNLAFGDKGDMYERKSFLHATQQLRDQIT